MSEQLLNAVQTAIPLNWKIRYTEGENAFIEVEVHNHSLLSNSEGTLDYQIYDLGNKIVIAYGNSDAGPISMHRSIMKSVIIDKDALSFYPLHKMLEHIFANYPPNEWGLT